jgi:capsid protein
VPFNHEGLFTIPQGWDVGQLKAEQPTATYEGFNGTLLAEFGRSIHSPRNKVTGDSSPYNYSSARLDDIDYRGTHRVERNRLAIAVLDRVFAAWWAEAVALPDFIPDADSLPPLADWSWAWQYDGAPSIDPVKDETATQIAFQTKTTNWSNEMAKRGANWQDHFRQIAAEVKLAKELGIEALLYPELAALAAAGAPPRPVAPDDASVRAMIRAMVQDEIDTVLDDRGVAHAR